MTGAPFLAGFFFKFLLVRGAGDGEVRVEAVLPGLEGVPEALPLRVCTPGPMAP